MTPAQFDIADKLTPGRGAIEQNIRFKIVRDFPDMLQDYPANTVRGRICLGLRLDWDKDPGQVFSKETSDIYIKVGFVKKSCNAIQHKAVRVQNPNFLISSQRSQNQRKSRTRQIQKIVLQNSSEHSKPK